MIVWGGTNASFGGDQPGVTHRDLWAFSLDSRTWQQLSAPGGPPGRTTATAVADPTRDRMIVVGGSAGTASNEVWSLGLGSLSWIRLPSGPPARFDAASTTNGQKAWVFGGFSSSGRALNDLWELDLATNTWRELRSSAARPAPRTNLGFAVIGNRLVVTGGHDEDETNPDTWSYDLATGGWSRLSEANTPAARAHYAFAHDTQCRLVWLYGGDNNDFNDSPELLALQPGSPAAFFSVASGPQPDARRHAAIVFDPGSRRIVLFGGWQGLDRVSGETWVASVPGCSNSSP